MKTKNFKLSFVAIAVAFACASALAAPVNGSFRVGAGTISAAGPVTSVNITTAAQAVAVIDWGSFNISSGETVGINSTVSVHDLTVVNVDHSGAMSHVAGTLTATSTALGTVNPQVNVLLVNPNGVSIDSGAVINATSFAAVAGTVDTTNPIKGLVTVRLNSNPVTIAASAAITTNQAAYGKANPVSWDSSVGVNTLPALFGAGANFNDFAAPVDGTGRVFNMANRSEGFGVTLPQDAVLNIENVTLGSGAVQFGNQDGTKLLTGTANVSNLTLEGSNFSLAAKSGGSSVLNLGDVSFQKVGTQYIPQLSLNDWLGSINLNGFYSSDDKAILELPNGALDSTGALNTNNVAVNFYNGLYGHPNNSLDPDYVAPSNFYNGPGTAQINLGGNSSFLYAMAPIFNNTDVVASGTVKIFADDIQSSNVSANKIEVSTRQGFIGSEQKDYGVSVGGDGSEVKLTAATAISVFAKGDVVIGTNAVIRAVNISEITTAAKDSVTYVDGASQTVNGGLFTHWFANVANAPVVNGLPAGVTATNPTDSPSSGYNALAPATGFGGGIVISSAANATVRGTLVTGKPPVVVPPVIPEPPVVVPEPPVVVPEPPVVVPPIVVPEPPPVVVPPVIPETPVVVPQEPVVEAPQITPPVVPSVPVIQVPAAPVVTAPITISIVPVQIPSLAPVIGVVAPVEVRTVRLNADLMFEFNKSELRAEGKAVLDAFAKDISATEYASLQVDGYTDRLGSDAYNNKLSVARANAVKDYLVAKAGIEAEKVVAEGHGEANPVTMGACSGSGSGSGSGVIACLAPDRRVELAITGVQK